MLAWENGKAQPSTVRRVGARWGLRTVLALMWSAQAGEPRQPESRRCEAVPSQVATSSMRPGEIHSEP